MDTDLIRIRYENAGEVRTSKVIWYLNRVNQRHRTFGFEHGEMVWLLPIAESKFLKLAALVGAISIGALLLGLILRGV